MSNIILYIIIYIMMMMMMMMMISPRECGERHIILGILALSFITTLKSSTNGVLYTQAKFGWTVTQYTNFQSFYVRTYLPTFIQDNNFLLF